MPTDDELVSVQVPRAYLSRVYGLIAQLDAPSNAPDVTTTVSVDPSQASEGTFDEWTNSLLARMIQESPPSMLAILRTLSSQPDEWVPSTTLIACLPSANANAMTLAGTLGAFGRRLANRYNGVRWPFDDRHDHELGVHAYLMPSDMALRIQALLPDS